jgi:predicted nucleic acid-binding protein
MHLGGGWWPAAGADGAWRDGEETAGGSIPPSTGRILVPDAGVGVQWFVLEDHSHDAKRLLDPRFHLHVPSHFFTEAASVLQRKVAVERTLTEADGLEAFRHLGTVTVTIHPTERLLEDAFRLGVRYRRLVDDSLYLVLAAALGGRVVTADRRLYNGVHGGPLDHLVLWVDDPLC